MSTARVIFIRHGDYYQLKGVPSAHQPFALTKKGFTQAEDCAQKLVEMQKRLGLVFDPVIFSSQQLRAWQTAEVINTRLDEIIDVKCYDALAERSLGSVGNLAVDVIEAVMADDPRYPLPPDNWKSNSHFRLPYSGAESLMDAGERVAGFLKKSVLEKQNHSDERVKIIVGHGASFRHAAHLLGLLNFEEIAKLSLYHASPLLFEIDDQGRWKKVDGEWKIRAPREEAND